MQTGRLDKRIVIQSVVITPDATGEPISVYSTLATVWAFQQSQSAKEIYNAGMQRVAEEISIWNIRYRSDITVLMRVVHNSKVYDIKGISEIGRKDGLMLITEAILA
jgi:SPP1 family predicted phage head-tail adaptor